MSKQYCNLCRASTTNSVINVPKDENKRKRWSESTGVEFHVHNRICDKHFKDTDFYYVSQKTPKRRRLMPNAMPQKLELKNPFTEHLSSECGDNRFDFSSQTEQEVVDSGLALENLLLQKKIGELQKENANLAKKLLDTQTLTDSLKTIFTDSQVRKLQNGNKRIKWNRDDISYAICLHTAGPRAYRHLIKKGFPLPCISTLDKWLHSVEIQPGLLDFVIDIMENAVDIDDEDKICILSFDEMRLMSSDSSLEVIQQSRDYAQVVMAQGLRKSWKQPIYFDFDKAMSIPTLHMLIQKLYTIGYHVVGIVSDLGPSNQKLWTNLDISPEKCWFEHPSDSVMKVFVFADAPHLLKLIRNHFLDSGLVLGGKIITEKTIRQTMVHVADSKHSITWKVNEDHLNMRSVGKQNVKLAIQLLSKTTATAIRQCSALDLEVENACETANFIQLTNDWFDIFNVKQPTSNNVPFKQPFGQSIETQQRVLTKMTTLMSNIIIPNGKKCLPFQKGIIVSNTSLDLLYQYVADMYNMDYLITSRISLDQLQHFCSIMRAKGGLHDHPTTSEFKFRLRKHLLGNSYLKLEITDMDDDADLSGVSAEMNDQSKTKSNQDESDLIEECLEDSMQSCDSRASDELNAGTEMRVQSNGNVEKTNINSIEKEGVSVHNKNQFLCQRCPEVFDQSAQLIAHLRTHKDEKTVPTLSECLQSITQKNGLTIVRGAPPKQTTTTLPMQVDQD